MPEFHGDTCIPEKCSVFDIGVYPMEQDAYEHPPWTLRLLVSGTQAGTEPYYTERTHLQQNSFVSETPDLILKPHDRIGCCLSRVWRDPSRKPALIAALERLPASNRTLLDGSVKENIKARQTQLSYKDVAIQVYSIRSEELIVLMPLLLGPFVDAFYMYAPATAVRPTDYMSVDGNVPEEADETFTEAGAEVNEVSYMMVYVQRPTKKRRSS